MLNNLKMRWKILLPVCLAVIAVFAATIFFIHQKLRETSEADIALLGQEMSLRHGNAVGRELDSVMSLAKGLAQMFAGAKTSGGVDRAALEAMLKPVLEDSPDLFGVWTTWEPDAFDGKDAEYAGKDAFHDATGRLIPYWYREGAKITGGVTTTYEGPSPGSDWYQKPLRGKKPYVTPPTSYDVGGKSIMLVSFGVPVMMNGKALGVAGVDLSLEKMADMASAIKIFETGYGYLLAADGMVVAHPKRELIGKPAEAAVGKASAAQALEAVKAGRPYSFRQETPAGVMLHVLTPIRIGDTDTTWSFGVTIPEARVMENADALTRLLLILGVGGVLFVILAVFLISRAIVNPVNTLVAGAEAVAKGDLDRDIGVRQKDEIGILADAFRKMVAGLKDMIETANTKTREAEEMTRKARVAADEAEAARRQAEQAKREGMLDAARRIETIVERVTSASEELAAQIEESSRGTENQRERTSESATAMEQMNASVMEVARNASEAAGDADSAREEAQRGANVVNNVITAINEVHTQSERMRVSLGDLGQQAEGIGRIMNVITDIADQTNLLALNAAIEAARAGDAGRGFAVVADEVRKLAEKTMTATKEVGEAVSGIQTGTHQNIKSMEASGEAVGKSTELAGEAGKALTNIVGRVESTADKVRAIATASEEQSAASEQISRGTEEVNRIAAETAQAMNQSAQAVAELASMAQELQRLVDQMKNA